MHSCEWYDCHLQWSLIFFKVNSEHPRLVPAPTAAAVQAISIILLWPFSFCGRCKVWAGRKTITSTVNMLLPTAQHILTFILNCNKIKVKRKRNLPRICRHLFLALFHHTLLCKTLRRRLDPLLIVPELFCFCFPEILSEFSCSRRRGAIRSLDDSILTLTVCTNISASSQIPTRSIKCCL